MILEKYIAKFGNSRPIFVLTVNNNRIDASLKERYNASADVDETDHISKLVRTHYRESLRNSRYHKETRDIRDNCIYAMLAEFRKFVDVYGGFKNAKQSKIYRFLNSEYTFRNNNDLIDGLTLLYRYAKDQGMDKGRLALTGKDDHISNILLILEEMRAKHEESKS